MSGIAVGLKEGLMLLLVSITINLILYGFASAGVISCQNEYTSTMNNTFGSNYTEGSEAGGFIKTILNMATNKCEGVPTWLYWISILIFIVGIAIMTLAIIPFT